MNDSMLVKKAFYNMLVPTILMNLITCVSTAADTIIVGNFLGEKALTAVTFSTPLYMLINTVGALLAVGGTTAMSIAAGRGEKEKADEIFSESLIWGVLISVVIAALGAGFIDPVVKMLGAEGSVAGLTKSYAVIVFYMAPAFIINITLAFLARNDGRPNLAMAAMLTSIVVNIVLDIVFIVPLRMGIAGAALATGLSQVLSACMILTHFWSKKNTLKFVMRMSFEKLSLIFKSGAGTSLHFIYQFITILFFNNLIMRTAGDGGIVVYTVVMNISTIAMSLFEGLSQTIQPMVSVYYGENNNESIRMAMKLAGRMTLILGGAVTVLLELFPYPVVAAFGLTEPQLVLASAAAIRIFSACIIVMTVNAVMGYYYQSTEKSGLATIIVVSRNLAMLLPGAALLGSVFGLSGIWGAYLFAEAATLLIWLAYAVYKGRKTTGGILLLPPVRDTYVSFLNGETSELDKALTEIESFLTLRNIDGKRARRIRLAVEELVANVISHNDRLKHVEVRIVIGADILVIIRDDGILFDHSLFEYAQAPEIEGGNGIHLIRKTAKSFEYMPVLGFNRTLLTY